MERLNISFPDETRQQLEALTRGVKEYGGNRSEVVRVAVERLYNFHFHAISDAPDIVLSRIREHLQVALGTIEYEQARRAELKDE